jgi:division/cell wall cluster transcriptional repressor MraZ
MKKPAGGAFNGLFLNEYEHSLDSQSRVTLPSSWRKPEGETVLILMPARDNALLLLPVETFLEFIERAKKFAIANAKLQAAFAFIGSSSRECRCDKQGRIALDRKMLDSIGVGTQLKMAGAINHIRICAPDNWQMPGDASVYLDEIERVSEDGGNLGALLEGVLKHQ